MGHVQKAAAPTAPLQLLTEIEVSQMTKISVKTLQRWRCVGDGPLFTKLGEGKKAPVRYDARDIQTYVEQGRRYPSVRATQGE
jgi:hypothetical protein